MSFNAFHAFTAAFPILAKQCSESKSRECHFTFPFKENLSEIQCRDCFYFCYLQIRKNDGKGSCLSSHLLAPRHCPFSKPWLVAMLPGSEGEEGRRGGELRVTWPQACPVIGTVHTTPHGVKEEALILLPSTHTPPVQLCLQVTHFMTKNSWGLQTLVMILQWKPVQV